MAGGPLVPEDQADSNSNPNLEDSDASVMNCPLRPLTRK